METPATTEFWSKHQYAVAKFTPILESGMDSKRERKRKRVYKIWSMLFTSRDSEECSSAWATWTRKYLAPNSQYTLTEWLSLSDRELAAILHRVDGTRRGLDALEITEALLAINRLRVHR